MPRLMVVGPINKLGVIMGSGDKSNGSIGVVQGNIYYIGGVVQYYRTGFDCN